MTSRDFSRLSICVYEVFKIADRTAPKFWDRNPEITEEIRERRGLRASEWDDCEEDSDDE